MNLYTELIYYSFYDLYIKIVSYSQELDYSYLSRRWYHLFLSVPKTNSWCEVFLIKVKLWMVFSGGGWSLWNIGQYVIWVSYFSLSSRFFIFKMHYLQFIGIYVSFELTRFSQLLLICINYDTIWNYNYFYLINYTNVNN